MIGIHKEATSVSKQKQLLKGFTDESNKKVCKIYF